MKKHASFSILQMDFIEERYIGSALMDAFEVCDAWRAGFVLTQLPQGDAISSVHRTPLRIH